MSENLPVPFSTTALATLEDHARNLVLRDRQAFTLKRGALVFRAGEVVTRLLSDFSERGWVEVARGRAMIRDEAALELMAAPM